ncbi:MAG: hypothetical protein J6X79_04855 [Bacteroidales bacterium]|nr:hypothetical protein [Bacteroidales bacterium]
MHKKNEDGKIYHGDWQEGSVIQQRLEGPVGNGSIDYPNGDRFEGYFHLSFAHINGPAFMASGNYTFANDDRIENCWIDGNDRLCGVYETLHTDGTRSIAMWCCGERVGMEVMVDNNTCDYRERGFLVNTYSGSDQFSYTYTPDSHGFNRLEVTLHNGMRIVQQYSDNNNEPGLFCKIYYPDGDWMEYRGSGILKDYRPWDGWFIYHRSADGMKKSDIWEEGAPQEKYDYNRWKHDDEGARRIPVECDPYGRPYGRDILLWPDGHTQWGYGFYYEGGQKDGLPEGRGVFYDDCGRRYEGEFHEGLCHGEGTYTFERAGITQSGRWERGRFLGSCQPAAAIMLKVCWSHDHCSPSGTFADGDEEWTIEAKAGTLDLPEYTCGITIEAIEPERIIVTSYGTDPRELTPGKTVRYFREEEGREWSDGCVYESDEYSIAITWIK